MKRVSRCLGLIRLFLVLTVSTAAAASAPNLDFTSSGSHYEWNVTPDEHGLFDFQHGDTSLTGRVFRGGRHWMADIDLEQNGIPKQISMVTLQDGFWSPVGTLCDRRRCRNWFVQIH